jgi:transcriptional regulator with XRE-family HTH domain
MSLCITNQSYLLEKAHNFKMTYGSRLDSAMKATKCTRKELALVLGITVNAIGMVITGGGREERWLSRENNKAAAHHLKVDEHWLWTGKEPPSVKQPDPVTKEAKSLDLVLKSIPAERRDKAYQEALQGLILQLGSQATAAPGPDSPEATPYGSPRTESLADTFRRH